MKNIRVEYSETAVVNIGDFQNLQPGFRIGADLEEGETVDEVRAKLVSKVDKWLDEEVAKIRNGQK